MNKNNETLAMQSDVFTLIMPRLKFDKKNELKGKIEEKKLKK